MILSNAAIDRRITVVVLLLLIIVAGLYSYLVIPREDNPEIIIPILLVTTTYEGVAPGDMESLVTIPIERKLTGLSGVKEIVSSSAEGRSFIRIEFMPDEDITEAHQRVRDKIDQAMPDLPDEADDPVIEEINVSELPMMFLSIIGDVGLPVLTNFGEDLEDELETVMGVLDVEVIGGVEREIQIIVDPDRAAELGVSLADLVVLARSENVNRPAGAMELGEAKFSVRVPGEFTHPDEIRNLIVKAGPEGNVYVRDVAEVYDSFKDIETISRVGGREAVTLSITKRAGENVIRIADEVRRIAATYEERLLPGMSIRVTMDMSQDIRDMVAELQNSILSGLILVLIVIFCFLGFLNAIMVALAIPVSMFITFIVLYATDTTLNMVVLFSLILALGMLVDNGIVVVENIYRHVQTGLPAKAAAKRGAAEVAWPIIASTLTTVAAFSPMFFWPGIWGSFMFFLPQTVSTALLASLFVGLIVNPALASLLMHFGVKRHRKSLEVGGAPRLNPLLRVYAALLRLALRWRAVTVTLAVALLVVIGAVFFSSAVVEFIPTTQPRQVHVDIDAPDGTALEATNAIVKQIEDMVSRYEENLDFVVANVGSRGASVFGFGGSSSSIGRVTLDFPNVAEAKVLPSEIVEDLRPRLAAITGAEVRLEKEEHGPSEEPPVNVEITGDDFAVLARLADEVADRIRDVPNLVDLRDDYEEGRPEIEIDVDREQALLLGLNTDFIGMAVMAAIHGRKAGEYREGDEEYDVTVRFPKHFREDLVNLASMTLVNLGGTAVPFSSIADMHMGAGLGSITRMDRTRTVTVMADVEAGEAEGNGQRTGAEVLKDVQRELDGFTLPPGYQIAYTGQNEEQEEAQAFLLKAFVMGLFLIALVLITQFNSVLQPLVIMSSVILSLAGVFLGLYLFNMPFSVIMTGVGCISLAGVVVNNAIVLLDFINQLRAQGVPAQEAIVQAGVTRFRPVMLTAITTILGLIPMAAGISFDFFKWKWLVGSESSQWWGSMAIAVIFGLAFATLLTLVVVPALYSLTASLTTVFRPETETAPQNTAEPGA